MNKETPVFIKKYSLPEAEVVKLFDKYKFLENLFVNDALVKVPKVYKIAGKTIVFEKINLQKMKTLHQIFATEEDKAIIKTCYEAGLRLAHIHKKNSSSGFVHGDFWGANIFLNETKSWLIIDWEPPLAIRGKEVDFFIKNKKELDLATFILHTAWGNFPVKQWYKYLFSKNDWQKSFLAGYLNQSDYTIDNKILNKFIKSEVKRVWELIGVENNFCKKIVKK